jgi:hypothetical protein
MLLPYTIILLVVATAMIGLDLWDSQIALILASSNYPVSTPLEHTCDLTGIVGGILQRTPLLISDGLLVSLKWQ